MEIKTIILQLDKDGTPNSIESRLVNEHLAILKKENYFSSSHVVIMGKKSNVITDTGGRIYVRQDCQFESLIMAQVTN